MKLYKYLNEDKLTINNTDNPLLEFKNILLKADIKKEYLEALVKSKSFVKRHQQMTKFSEVFTTRKNRRPTDTQPWLHEILNEWFYMEFGWKVRSEGVFTVGNKFYDEIYYENYFFPIGSYKYVWSEKIKDLFMFFYEELNNDKTYMHLLDAGRGDFNIPLVEYIDEILQKCKYTNKNLVDAIKSKNEIVFKCEKFILIKLDYNKNDNDDENDNNTNNLLKIVQDVLKDKY